MADSKPQANVDNLSSQQVREIPSNDLFKGQRIVVINHSGEQYRLTITRNDKLILQK